MAKEVTTVCHPCPLSLNETPRPPICDQRERDKVNNRKGRKHGKGRTESTGVLRSALDAGCLGSRDVSGCSNYK